MTMARQISFLLFLFLSAPYVLYGAPSESDLLIDRPEESITYWKNFEILPGEDPKVAIAQEIFQRLLLGWEETRVAPELHVVRSDQGPWAASLDDGTILLSRDAIDICWKGSADSGRDRLAFVLAHELSHQRADHLWHRRFFRLAGQQPPKVQGRMLGGMSVERLEGTTLEAKEIQADREGVLLMSMVGFEPQKVIADQGRFFFEWIENIWGVSCGDGEAVRACNKARERYERARTHLQDAARQSILFKLGVQSYVGGNYVMARKFFTVYGRQFPGREIHNNIGLTHLGEALGIRKQLLNKGENLGPGYVYPTVLEEAPGIQQGQRQLKKGLRSFDASNEKERKEMDRHLKKAIDSFERAIKIDPGHRPSYWNLISSYLLTGNAPLAYGATAGNYVKRFGQDATASMFLAISAHFEGDTQKAMRLFERAMHAAEESLVVILRMNRAVFFRASGDKKGARREWKKLAKLGKKRGDEALFRLAVSQIRNQKSPRPATKPGPTETINGYTIGQVVPPFPSETPEIQKEEIWLEGERIALYHFKNGARMAVDATRRVIALWRAGGDGETAAGIQMGDDHAKTGRAYGLPTRRIRTLQGDYLAYDTQRIAIRFVNNKVAAWLLYGGRP